MAENQRLKQVIGLSLSFFVILFSIFSPFYFSHKKCLFHRWRICLVLKHMYLNKVSHLSQSAIFATHLILLKTMTVQTLLSSWGKFVKFHWFQLFSLLLFLFFLGGGGVGVGFLDEVWNKIQDSIQVYLRQTSVFRCLIFTKACSCGSIEEIDQTEKSILRFNYFSGFSITISTHVLYVGNKTKILMGLSSLTLKNTNTLLSV